MKRAWLAGAGIVAIIITLAVLWRVTPLGSQSDQGRGGNHVVDGRPLGPEQSCPTIVSLDCDAAAAVGLQILKAGDPGATVTATAFAQPACPDGETSCLGAGIAQAWFVIFDVQGAPRRAIELMCSGPIYEGQQLATPASCYAAASQ